MMLEQRLDAAQANAELQSQDAFGRASSKLINNLLDVVGAQPISNSPDAASLPVHGPIGHFLILKPALSYSTGSLRQAFLQVSMVRVTPDKLHRGLPTELPVSYRQNCVGDR